MTSGDYMEARGTVTVVVPGDPQPQGSHRAYPVRRKDGSMGVAVAHDAQRLRDWRAVVAVCASRQIAAPLAGPIWLEVTFELTRPRGHFGSGRNADRLRRSAPVWHVTRPDLDKLTRAICDALTGIAWRDDSQVVAIRAQKLYADAARTVITLCGALAGGLRSARRPG